MLEAALFRRGEEDMGAGHRVYVIAEVSANHQQEFEKVAGLIAAAKEAGEEAVKLQTYTPDTITIRSDREIFRIGGGTLWDGRTLYDLYAEAFTPWDWQPKLKQIAQDHGLDLFSSPFDETAVDFMESMGASAYKVASFELVELPQVQKKGSTANPLIISAGMSTVVRLGMARPAT